jgi:regulator of sigma E protease
MVSLITFLIILGVLIIVHEFGHFLVAKRVGIKVEQFSLGFGPRIFKKKQGDTEYSVSLIPLGGYVKLAGDNLQEYRGERYEYLSKKPGERFWVVFFGPLFNYVLGFLCFWLVFVMGYPTLTTRIGGVLDGLGAKQAGLQTGDTITTIDGKRVQYWEELQAVIQSKQAVDTVNISFLRQGKENSLAVPLQSKEIEDVFGKKRKISLLGITPSDDVVTVRHGLIEGFMLSVRRTWGLTSLTYQAFWRMITGQLSMKESVTGPLGIYYITAKAASVGMAALIHLVAVLSISLAIFNLLPLPVLDGGHIFFLIIEKIRGRKLSIKAEQLISRIGFSLIITLAVVVTYNDVIRFFGEKISRFIK